MYMLAITMVLIIGMTLSVFAYDGMGIVKKWDNLCKLEVGKEYAKYGFTYYVPVEMTPGEYIDAQKYMAFIRPDYNSDIAPPKGSQQHGAGYFVEYYWADPGEVNLVDTSKTDIAYPSSTSLPFQVSGDYYPDPPKGSISLAYLLRSLNGWDYYTPEEGLYIASVVPLKTTLDGNTSYSINPTKNVVFVKFFPSDQFGVASMERIGVVQIGHLPTIGYFVKYLGMDTFGDVVDVVITVSDNKKDLPFDKNLIIWWGSDKIPVNIYEIK